MTTEVVRRALAEIVSGGLMQALERSDDPRSRELLRLIEQMDREVPEVLAEVMDAVAVDVSTWIEGGR